MGRGVRTCVHAQRRAQCGCTCQSCSFRKDGRASKDLRNFKGTLRSDRWKNIGGKKPKQLKLKSSQLKTCPLCSFYKNRKTPILPVSSFHSLPTGPQEEPFSLGGRRETLHHNSEKQACHIPKLKTQHTAHVLQTCSNDVPLLEENRPFLRAL